ncbi:U3 small nucleolar RNA-associated protein 18 homolog [Homarus americanus]|uniref:U3 small nucleolar RNA-associated protein 18-like n=1 Tax=Homarus americanus TaxID=6706 RepID=A0A8J5JUV0_HOMAM|nr:U3 small nucleolar RNA-associated protein 18 homolog [Homarus americanus]XP_042229632.1 U3 small nucleolar RNA-associated protein 18 homolog [Homarus americanus]XP_042229633.1 U3 small nucleolar RNA-associated protein 18 homolog [Homarus americanus]XP_042229634.1 U3 small nucleolar RNA-associated protein 18 homolog [Homarus americanus]KAG7164641.1 U3 small nucleolar RNA-associated protein 18-like [Homarus americanus]
MKKKQQQSSKEIPAKGNSGKKMTKKKTKGVKQKRNKDKGRSLLSNKFILDTRGSKRSKFQKQLRRKKMSNSTRTNVLGYDKLMEQERKLAKDLFGEDAELLHSVPQEAQTRDLPAASTDSTISTEEQQMIPDDPFDVHQPDTKDARKPAWVDEDDDNIRVKDICASMTKARGKRGIREVSNVKYELKLQEKFSQVFGSTPEWADLNNKLTGDSDDDDEMTRTTGNYLSAESSGKLPKTSLEYKKLHDLNHTSRSEGAVLKAVEFNPRFQVGLVAGFSNNSFGAATLFQVDGSLNHKIQSIKFPKFTIKCAKFLQDGKKFVVGSNLYGHFFVYDMEAAKEMRIPCSKTEERSSMKNFIVSPDGELLVFVGTKGLLYVFDATTLSLIDTFHSPEEVKAAAFNESGSKMYTHGIGGDVFVWDMTSRACVHRFYDDGCIDGTSIAVSPSNQFLACGSSSGIVNIYDVANISSKAPRPVKILDKLVTPVTSLAFNPSSEILAMASDYVDNAMKLIHFPSMTHFNNFPGGQYPLRRVQVLNFSPKGGFLAAGNNNGAAPLYRLKHFSSY